MDWTSPVTHDRLRILFVLWSNLLLMGYLYLSVPITVVVLAFCALNASLVTLGCIGLRTKMAIFMMPNIIVKFIVIVFFLFVGCVSLDSIHVKFRKNIGDSGEIIEETEVIRDPLVRAFLPADQDPFFVFWLMCFILLLTAEVRMFFSECYKVLFMSVEESENGQNGKPSPPPSYAYCVEQKNEIDSGLPTYKEAITRRDSEQAPTPPVNADAPCSSRSLSSITITCEPRYNREDYESKMALEHMKYYATAMP